MDMAPASRRAPHDDLVAIPEHLVAEIVDGQLVTSPRPRTPHARTTTAIGHDLIDLARWWRPTP